VPTAASSTNRSTYDRLVQCLYFEMRETIRGYKPIPTAAQSEPAADYSKPASGGSGVLGSSSRQLPVTLGQGANGVSIISSCKRAAPWGDGDVGGGAAANAAAVAPANEPPPAADFAALRKARRAEAAKRKRLENKTAAPGSDLARKHAKTAESERLRQEKRRHHF